MVAVLNKMDAAQKKQLVINEKSIAKALGCPVVSLCAHDKGSVTKFKKQLKSLSEKKLSTPITLNYGDFLEPVIEQASSALDSATERLEKRALGNQIIRKRCQRYAVMHAGRYTAY